jgi:hypothetical protein
MVAHFLTDHALGARGHFVLQSNRDGSSNDFVTSRRSYVSRNQHWLERCSTRLPKITFVMEVCNLWVCLRESLGLFERNSVSSDSDKLLEANTVGGSWYSAVASCTWDSSKLLNDHTEGEVSIRVHVFTVLIHFHACYTPIRLTKEVVRPDGLWWTGSGCRVYKGIANTGAPRCKCVEYVCCF